MLLTPIKHFVTLNLLLQNEKTRWLWELVTLWTLVKRYKEYCLLTDSPEYVKLLLWCQTADQIGEQHILAATEVISSWCNISWWLIVVVTMLPVWEVTRILYGRLSGFSIAISSKTSPPLPDDWNKHMLFYIKSPLAYLLLPITAHISFQEPDKNWSFQQTCMHSQFSVEKLFNYYSDNEISLKSFLPYLNIGH